MMEQCELIGGKYHNPSEKCLLVTGFVNDTDWSSAYNLCAALKYASPYTKYAQGRLVENIDNSQWQFLRFNFETLLTADGTWIGAKAAVTSPTGLNDYQWVLTSTPVFDTDPIIMPSNRDGSIVTVSTLSAKNCIMILRAGTYLSWVDEDCSIALNFVCELTTG
jgi:hypothetical protein